MRFIPKENSKAVLAVTGLQFACLFSMGVWYLILRLLSFDTASLFVLCLTFFLVVGLEVFLCVETYKQSKRQPAF